MHAFVFLDMVLLYPVYAKYVQCIVMLMPLDIAIASLDILLTSIDDVREYAGRILV